MLIDVGWNFGCSPTSAGDGEDSGIWMALLEHRVLIQNAILPANEHGCFVVLVIEHLLAHKGQAVLTVTEIRAIQHDRKPGIFLGEMALEEQRLKDGHHPVFLYS